MVEADTTALPAVRGHLIRRPRLERLLDATGARLILLLAPAGFGKTTLARQWTEDKPHGWYRGGPASADVAALCVGIAEAASVLLPGCDTRIRERLTATRDPEAEAEVLAEIVAEDVAGWPEDAWLVFDDYHHAMEAPASERFVETLLDRTELNLLCTSRSRPAWATARGVAYGEILVVSRESLAMTDAESTSILGESAASFGVAEGWPAIIGLAAQARDLGLLGRLKKQVEDYLAELYEQLSPEIRAGLATLAVTPVISDGSVRRTQGRASKLVLSAGLRLGVLTRSERSALYEIQRIWRSFLSKRFAGLDTQDRSARLSPVIDSLIANGNWDEAFAIIRAHVVPETLHRLVAASLYELLDRGRLATLAQWLTFADRVKVSDGVLDLARGELEFRQGNYLSAQIHAEKAMGLLKDSRLTAKARLRAGYGALLASDYLRADANLASAAEAVDDHTDLREALIGRFFARLELEAADAVEYLERAEALADPGAPAAMRTATGRLLLAARRGEIDQAITRASPLLSLSNSVSDPLVRSSFHYVLAGVLCDTGRYEEGLAQATRAVRIGDRYKLDHVRWHGLDMRAQALIGLREFDEALAVVHRIREAAEARGDAYAVANVEVLRAKLALSSVDSTMAPQLTPIDASVLSAGMKAEYLAALALVERRFHGSGEIAERAMAAGGQTRSHEAWALLRWLEVVLLDADATDSASAAVRAFEEAAEAGHIDAFVSCYRAWPDLLPGIIENAGRRARVAVILGNARDIAIAASLGIAIKSEMRAVSLKSLTPREGEVLALLRRGLSNKEIASRLLITEPTAKLYVRKILGKLGARSRTEAVALVSRQALSDSDRHKH